MSTTYFFNDTAGCTGSASGFDDTLDETTPSGGEKEDTISAGTTDRISHRLTNPTGVPGLTTWDAGDYVATVDIVSRGNNIDMAALFRRVNASCVEQGGGPLGTTSEIDPPTVGVNVFTLSGVSEQSPGSDERLQVDLLVDNDHGHASQSVSVDYTDSTVTAPWTIGAVSRPHYYNLLRRVAGGNG